MRFVATAEQREWLMENIPGRLLDDVLGEFNSLFSIAISREQLKNFAARNKVRSGVRRRPMNSIWDDEREAYFREIVPGREESEIRAMFLERFGVELSESQIGNAKKKLGVKSGTHGGRFRKGIVPWTKGRRQADYLSADAMERVRAHQFKPGDGNGRDLPIGSEYRDKDGYVYVKASMDGATRFGRGGKWRPRAVLEWERGSGMELPDGYRVVHVNKVVDDDRYENLEAVPIREYVRINRNGATYADRDTCDICREIAGLELKASELRRGEE